MGIPSDNTTLRENKPKNTWELIFFRVFVLVLFDKIKLFSRFQMYDCNNNTIDLL